MGVAASIVTAVAFGIIVDDTIHFMTKYIKVRKCDLLPMALDVALDGMRRTSGNMMATSERVA